MLLHKKGEQSLQCSYFSLIDFILIKFSLSKKELLHKIVLKQSLILCDSNIRLTITSLPPDIIKQSYLD